MQGEHLERWQILSREALREQDPHRFLELIRDTLRTLAEKERRYNPRGRRTKARPRGFICKDTHDPVSKPSLMTLRIVGRSVCDRRESLFN